MAIFACMSCGIALIVPVAPEISVGKLAKPVVLKANLFPISPLVTCTFPSAFGVEPLQVGWIATIVASMPILILKGADSALQFVAFGISTFNL